jgi:hypothetical protein
LINIVDNTQKSIFTVYLHNHIYWFEMQQSYQKLSLFLHQQTQKFTIDNHGTHLNFIIGKQYCKIPIFEQNNIIKIGIIRQDLLRYRGQIVPEQSLYVNTIEITR